MNMCSDNHDEIVYDSRFCPVCTALQEIIDLKSSFNLLENDYLQLEEKYEELKDNVLENAPEIII